MDAVTMITTKEEIAAAIQIGFTAFADYTAGLGQVAFTYTPNGKWSAGQHAEHLLRSARPVYMALGLPGFLLRLLFGKPNRQARAYDELVAKYQAKLLAGGAASGRFVPPPVQFAQKGAKMKQFIQLQQKLQARVLRLSDKKLDNCLLPHPLLGKLTLREMLYFTVYHTGHHLTILQKQQQGQA
jgi:DinB superfamily